MRSQCLTENVLVFISLIIVWYCIEGKLFFKTVKTCRGYLCVHTSIVKTQRGCMKNFPRIYFFLEQIFLCQVVLHEFAPKWFTSLSFNCLERGFIKKNSTCVTVSESRLMTWLFLVLSPIAKKISWRARRANFRWNQARIFSAIVEFTMTEIIDLEDTSQDLDYDSLYSKDSNNNRTDVESPNDSGLDV